MKHSDQQLLFKSEDFERSLWNKIVGKYPLKTKPPAKPQIPMCVGNKSNLVAAADDNCNMYIWKNYKDIGRNIGQNFTGHTSIIERVEFSEDDTRLITLGQSDHTILQWKVEQIHAQTPSLLSDQDPASTAAGIFTLPDNENDP
jgi:WD40 repeat protein